MFSKVLTKTDHEFKFAIFQLQINSSYELLLYADRNWNLNEKISKEAICYQITFIRSSPLYSFTQKHGSTQTVSSTETVIRFKTPIAIRNISNN